MKFSFAKIGPTIEVAPKCLCRRVKWSARFQDSSAETILFGHLATQVRFPYLFRIAYQTTTVQNIQKTLGQNSLKSHSLSLSLFSNRTLNEKLAEPEQTFTGFVRV